MYYTYMLKCVDNTIYTGITVDIKRRMNEHFLKTQKCAKYTRTHDAKELLAVWQSENRVFASKLEFYIKKLTRKQKDKLVSDMDLSILNDKIDIKQYKYIAIGFKVED